MWIIFIIYSSWFVVIVVVVVGLGCCLVLLIFALIFCHKSSEPSFLNKLCS